MRKPRIALITGATGGLGEAVLRAFLDHGCHVAATFRRDAARDEFLTHAQGRPLLPVKADATRIDEIDAAVAQAIVHFGRIDYLINLVGGWSGGPPIWETAPEEWDRLMALNLRSAFAICRAVVPHMLAQRYGRIVNVSSRSAVRPTAGDAAYAVSKAGVVTLTETLALELRKHPGDITANCVLPSIIDTPANRRDMPKADYSSWVDPNQLAAIIAWLTSDDAAPISGAAIPVYART